MQYKKFYIMATAITCTTVIMCSNSANYFSFSDSVANSIALCSVAAQGAQQLVVEPFDKSILKDIEKAIVMADLNLTPTNDGSGILRINIPPLTEESRKKLVTQAKKIAEEGKVAVRNIRRDAVDKIKAAEKNKEISKDDSKDFQVIY